LSEEQSLAISARNRNISVEEAKNMIRQEEVERIKRATPVACFDSRGNFLNKYESVKEASGALNIPTGTIRSFLNGDKLLPVRGFVFSKINDDGTVTTPVIRKHKTTEMGIKIAQYDIHGTLIRVFDSKNEVIKSLRMNGRDLNRVISGEYKQFKGFVYKCL
jgi:hypothetical protein